MHVRRFQGKTVQAALEKAKEELGDDATIIQTRPVRSGRLRKNSYVEITVASDSDLGRVGKRIETKPSALDSQTVGASPRSRGEAKETCFAPTKSDTIEQIVERANTILTASNYGKQAEGQEGERASNPLAPLPLSPPMMNYIGSELSEIRDVLHILLNSVRLEDAAELPEIVQGVYKTFINNDIEPDIAYDLARGMEDCFNNDDGPSIQKHLSLLIGKLVKTAVGAKQRERASPLGSKKTIIALIGPTGVGKTTTVAKIAAQYKIKQKKRVVLMTIDNYRIAAINQLKTYAEIISAPFEVAAEPEELAQKINEHEEADLILIDTPGRSQLEAMRLREIEAFLNAARPTETHLLISSTMRNEDMYSVLEKFGSVGVDRLIFTKLDETTCFGTILNASVKASKPIAYLTTGQDVSSDIELARPERIASFLLRGFRKNEE